MSKPITAGTKVKLRSGEVGIVTEMVWNPFEDEIWFTVQTPPCTNNPCTCGTPGDSFHDDGLRDALAEEVEVVE